MSEQARVLSIEGVAEFRTSLCTFGDEAKEAIVSVDMELRRAVDWLHDRLQAWQAFVKKQEHVVAEAKIVLNRKKISRIFGRQPDTTEEEEILRKATARLREAEAKVERCRRWGPQLQHAIGEYEGPARQLGAILDADLPKTVAALDRMIEALEAYVRLEAPAGTAAPLVTSNNEMTSAATSGEEIERGKSPGGSP